MLAPFTFDVILGKSGQVFATWHKIGEDSTFAHAAHRRMPCHFVCISAFSMVLQLYKLSLLGDASH